MLIGTDFFMSHRIYVANGQRRIYFTYEGSQPFEAKPESTTTPEATKVAMANWFRVERDSQKPGRDEVAARSGGAPVAGQ